MTKKYKCNKLRCKSLDEANIHLSNVQVINEMNGRRTKNKNLHVYYCKYCECYHIGHKMKKNRPAQH